MTAVDPVPQRDVSFMLTKVYPALRALVRMGYFSLSVEGAENVPRQGAAVYVGNHAGWFPLDAFICGLALTDCVGADRLPWGAVQDHVLKVPWLGRRFERAGGFPASLLRDPRELPPEMQIFSVHPEGTEGNCKPFWRAYQMRRWRTGFLRLAVARRAVVVPVTIIGGEECLPVVVTIRVLEPLMGTILPLPLFALPLPSRWKVIFHPPVSVDRLDADSEEDDDDARRQRYRQFADSIQSTVQKALDGETSNHRLVRLARFLAKSPELAPGRSGSRRGRGAFTSFFQRVGARE